MDSDSEDFVYVGTPLEQEEEQRGYRKKVTDLAVTKALPVHKQEATDAEGRRRFHGAFTGGFSAGYYNTVGSEEGWAPSEWRSARDSPGCSAGFSADGSADGSAGGSADGSAGGSAGLSCLPVLNFLRNFHSPAPKL